MDRRGDSGVNDQMRAVLCKRFGPVDDLELGEIDAPDPGPGEVLVDVQAASVQFVDIRVIEGRSLLNTTKLDAHFGRKLKVELPITPGSEAAGFVSRVGDGVISVKPGDRVLATGLVGAWAEKAVFQSDEVSRIPDEMTFGTAAVFYVLYFTSFYALVRRAALEPRETLLVLGAGSGVGLASVEIGKALGAFVIAAASSDEKLACDAGHELQGAFSLHWLFGRSSVDSDARHLQQKCRIARHRARRRQAVAGRESGAALEPLRLVSRG